MREIKLFAHRGGSYGRENSLETMTAAAKNGADAVECDLRVTSDGKYVIFHDRNLMRLAGIDKKTGDVSFAELQKLLEDRGAGLMTFDDLAAGYREKTPLLLHLKTDLRDAAVAKKITSSGLPLIVGASTLASLECFARFLPKEKLLGFPGRPEYVRDFYENGAGYIRLWEQWLGEITPAAVKAACPGVKVVVMLCSSDSRVYNQLPLESMDGSEQSLDKCLALGADAAMLNNIDMALAWRKKG